MRILICSLISLAVPVCLHTSSNEARSPEAIEVSEPLELVPTGDKSWSLFLVCNPSWLDPQQNSNLLERWWKFNSFGEAIGTDDTVVWLWYTVSPDFEKIAENMDDGRSAKYCATQALVPSERAHIIITSTHPDMKVETGNFEQPLFGAKLNGLSASEIELVVGFIADKMITDSLDQDDSRSKEFWPSFRSVVSSVFEDLGS